MPWAWGPSEVGAHEESREEKVRVGGMPDGLTHTDTKVELVECTPARKETRVGDGCSKWQKSRGRDEGADVGVEPADRAVFAGQRENPACDNYRGKKNDLLTVVFEGNLKPGLTGYLTGSR